MIFDKSKKIIKLASDQCLQCFKPANKNKRKDKNGFKTSAASLPSVGRFQVKINVWSRYTYVHKLVVLRVIGVRKYYVPIFQGVKM